MSDQPPKALRVGVDLRCLVDGELRGFARYTLELISQLSKRPQVELIGITDRVIPVSVPVRQVVLRDPGSELLTEQIVLPITCARLAIQVLLCPANRGLPLLAPFPTVLTLHDTVEWDESLVHPPRGRSRIRFNYANIASLTSAARIIAPSHYSANQIVRTLGINAERVGVVHEAAAARFFDEPSESNLREVRARYKLPPTFILYLGGYELKKDVPTLLRALASARDTLPPLVLAGDASRSRQTIEMIDALGLSEHVQLPGFVDDRDLPCLYRLASSYVTAAVAEGFGLPVVEAMASHTPVVVADGGALPEVVGVGGQVFPPHDDRHLSALLKELLSDESEMRHWGARAAARAAEFTWARTAEQTEFVLRDAAQTSMLRRFGASLGAVRRLGMWIR